jgi:hypothetical protein
MAGTRRVLSSQLGIDPKDFTCPFPDLQFKEDVLPSFESNPDEWLRRARKKCGEQAPCKHQGELKGEPLPNKPCIGAPVECTHPDNPNKEWWTGWCKPGKCKFYEPKEE